jgi:pimeloyl-ACP methyl ester carboxylesterase
MIIVLSILGWIFAIIFGLLTISMVMLHNWLQAIITFLLVILCLPPVYSLLENRFDFSIHPLLHAGLIVGLFLVFVWLLLSGNATSIYKSPEAKAQLMSIYDEKMREWPIPYEDVYIDTDYGKVNVIVSGPEDAPPMLLLHASGVAGWSWKYNVEALSQDFHTYAIDLIGDAGKSELNSREHFMKTREDQADLYADITNKLGIEKAYVVGASEGGFIGSNYSFYYPERVEKLALLGPMGYSGATQSILRIMFAQMFPIKPIQDSTFSWAFSDDPKLEKDLGEWFRLYMSAYNATKVAPMPLAPEVRQNIQVPVLFVFGEKDNLVGDTQKAKALVQDMPDVQVEIVEAGHLMAGEKPEQVDELILNFFRK